MVGSGNNPNIDSGRTRQDARDSDISEFGPELRAILTELRESTSELSPDQRLDEYKKFTKVLVDSEVIEPDSAQTLATLLQSDQPIEEIEKLFCNLITAEILERLSSLLPRDQIRSQPGRHLGSGAEDPRRLYLDELGAGRRVATLPDDEQAAWFARKKAEERIERDDKILETLTAAIERFGEDQRKKKDDQAKEQQELVAYLIDDLKKNGLWPIGQFDPGSLAVLGA